MKTRMLMTASALIYALAAAFAAVPAHAEKPSWAGEKGAKGKSDKQDERHGESHGSNGKVEHFGDQHRVAVREYYGQHYGENYKSGRCPPGLAKKHNGCMPPGQAKKWQMGRPLPRDVVYYEVPRPLVVQLGQPPSGYRYVRVAGDILMIAIGTSMVVDAIQDLGR
jgi:Ni/Co efflux regulator RcnB